MLTEASSMFVGLNGNLSSNAHNYIHSVYVAFCPKNLNFVHQTFLWWEWSGDETMHAEPSLASYTLQSKRKEDFAYNDLCCTPGFWRDQSPSWFLKCAVTSSNAMC